MKNRWLIALSAIGIHICIGSVYAWSVLTKPIMQAMGFTLKETTWTFSIAILFLGLSAGFLGDYVEKYGPRKSGLTSTCFFGCELSIREDTFDVNAGRPAVACFRWFKI